MWTGGSGTRESAAPGIMTGRDIGEIGEWVTAPFGEDFRDHRAGVISAPQRRRRLESRACHEACLDFGRDTGDLGIKTFKYWIVLLNRPICMVFIQNRCKYTYKYTYTYTYTTELRHRTKIINAQAEIATSPFDFARSILMSPITTISRHPFEKSHPRWVHARMHSQGPVSG